MYNEISLFPLNIVVYPGELVNLHIFEPRYKDLINDCIRNKIGFGIPTFSSTKLSYGTYVEILEVAKVYEDGRMDIRTKGKEIFKVIDFFNPWKDYQYSGGKVEFLQNSLDSIYETSEKMLSLSQQLFSWLKMKDKFKLNNDYLAYSIAHKVGLNLEEEFELLQILDEDKRQNFLIRHLENLLPALERAEVAKERIMMNGHFRHLVPPNF